MKHIATDDTASYRPRLDTSAWEATRPFVQAILADRCADYSAGQRRMALKRLSRFAAWLHTTGYAQLDERALNPDLIDYYWHHRRTVVTEQTAKQERKLLRALAGIAPSIERDLPASRSEVKSPYSESELRDFRRWAHWLRLPGHRRDASALLALCAGCGLSAGELMHVRRGHIVQLADQKLGVTVTVRSPRTVPVLQAWADDLAKVRDGELEELVFSPGSRTRNGNQLVNVIREIPGESRPVAGRLRTTWLTRHLEAGTRLDILLPAAGLKDANSLAPLVRHLKPMRSEAALAQLRLGGGQ